MEYLNDNKVLYRYLSGFRKNHSTDTCLPCLRVKTWIDFDYGLSARTILIDLQKDFDSINHDTLVKIPSIEKMSSIGFSVQSTAWIESYLSNRRFWLNIKKKYFNLAKIKGGVLQGSILGPLLILLYVNDIFQTRDCGLTLCADDSYLMY